MAQSRRLYTRLPNMKQQCLDCILLVTTFFLIPPEYFVQGKIDFLCDTIGWIACCVLYTDPILLFIFLRFIPERLGYIRSIENIFEKQLSPWRGLFVSKLYLQLPWALTWTQREKKKKLDPIHLINLFYLSPVLFLLLSINQCARWAGKSRWKIVSRLD